MTKNNLQRGLFNGAALALLVYALIALCSCTTTKTTTQTKVQKNDSSQYTAVSHQLDTSSSYRDVAADDIDFVVTYSPYDSANDRAVRTISNQQFLASAHAQNDRFNWLPDHSRIVSISGHIGRLSDSSGIRISHVKTDTVVAKTGSVTVVATDMQSVTKNWLSTFPWWIIALVIGILLLIVFIVKKLLL